MSIPAVLHPEIVDFLRKLPEGNFQERVWHCIQKLKAQQFDGGVRVKKLKGIAKRVWEARIDRASRLIFTYEKSRQPETGSAQVYLAIQDLCLDHDDVSRRARARHHTPDAQWLDAEAVETLGDWDGDRPTKKPENRLSLETVRQEELAIAPDFDGDELLGNIQWQVLESEAQWHQAIVSQDADLPLKLSVEESQLIKLPGTLFLSGSAGTGKTTVALYRLLESWQDYPQGKRLYVAYNPLLVSNAREQFQHLVGKQNPLLQTIFEFKTLRDLCLELLQKAGETYRAEEEVNFLGFWELYKAHPKRKTYPPALVWDEIRSIVKGSQLATNSDTLSKKEYERLSKKGFTIIPKNQRYDLYKIVEWYQKKLRQDGRFDEIDLARKGLQVVGNGERDRYQLIVCDEVQDFTELHLELLMQLCAPEGQFLFAGDLHQMISPSGFRWEDLKQKFYQTDRDAIERTLNFNFRSVGSLVNLANQLLKLRSRLLNVPLGHVSLPGVNRGEAARLIAQPPEALKPILEELNPSDAILVRTDEEKQTLAQEFESTLIFTIEEAKGLEFDTVFLVEFFAANEELWNRLFRTGSVKQKEKPLLQLELNLLYVAVTRARRLLNIWESTLSPMWSQKELIDYVLPLNPEFVKHDRVEATPQTWRDRGLYYLKAEFYPQAIECFEKAGDRIRAQQARAQLMVQKREYLAAANVFAELEEWETAAHLFEKQKQWREAANCWAQTDRTESGQLAEIYALEAELEWEAAAQRWEDREEWEAAKRCWLNSNDERKKGEILAAEFAEKKQWLKAAQQYEIAGEPAKARECRALEFERRQQYERAAEVYEELGWSQKALECRAKIPIETPENNPVGFGERGNLRLNAGNYQGAIADYNEAIRMKPLFPYTYHNRAVAYHRLDRYAEAIEDYTRAIERMAENDPGLARSYSYRGVARAAVADYAGAIEDYTKVVLLDPQDINAYTNRGAARYRLRDYRGAMEDYTKVLELEPDNAIAYGNRGAARSAMGDNPGAVEDLSQALAHNASLSQIYYQRGKARLAMGDNQGALADFNRELEVNPELMEVYYHRGKAYLALKNYEPAIADFDVELERNPNNSAAYNDRGVARSALKNHHGAIADFERAIAINPTYDAPYNNRACVRRDLGDTQGSIEDYNKAIEINPKYADAYYNRGVSHAVLDDIKQAIEDWTVSLNLKSTNPIAYYNRGLGRVKQGDTQGGLEDYTEALKQNPHFAEAYYNRAVTQYQLGHTQAAISDFQRAAKLYSDRGDLAGYKEATAKIQKLQTNPDNLLEDEAEEGNK